MNGKMRMDETKKAIIKTDKFYKKYAGKIDIDSECILLQETEKAVLIRYKLGEGLGFSNTPIWIPKSKIKTLNIVELLPSEIKKNFEVYINVEKDFGRTVSFSYEDYYNLSFKIIESII